MQLNYRPTRLLQDLVTGTLPKNITLNALVNVYSNLLNSPNLSQQLALIPKHFESFMRLFLDLSKEHSQLEQISALLNQKFLYNPFMTRTHRSVIIELISESNLIDELLKTSSSNKIPLLKDLFDDKFIRDQYPQIAQKIDKAYVALLLKQLDAYKAPMENVIKACQVYITLFSDSFEQSEKENLLFNNHSPNKNRPLPTPPQSDSAGKKKKTLQAPRKPLPQRPL